MRGAALISVIACALALNSCGNGTLPLDQQPPFPAIGNWTGPTWSKIGPTLGRPLDATSSNICQRGETFCMDAVVGEMRQRIAALGCSHLAPFATMYRQVSVEVRASARAHRYRDPAYVVHLDSVFATFYFHAVDSWRAGKLSQVPAVWRIAFAAADQQRVSVLGDMLLGMNAHISRDLPFALASIGLKEPGGVSAVPDVVAVNADIERAQAPMLAQIRDRYGKIAPPGDLPKWLKPSLVPKLISEWRLEAITNARDLINAHTKAQRVEVETRINDTAALRSLLIWRATLLKHPARDNATRNAYCASR
jgi:hypothetical protein